MLLSLVVTEVEVSMAQMWDSWGAVSRLEVCEGMLVVWEIVSGFPSSSSSQNLIALYWEGLAF
jgi:hypothetical protein